MLADTKSRVSCFYSDTLVSNGLFFLHTPDRNRVTTDTAHLVTVQLFLVSVHCLEERAYFLDYAGGNDRTGCLYRQKDVEGNAFLPFSMLWSRK